MAKHYKISLPVIIHGFSAVITQLVLMREFLNFFYGNEVIIGIILAVWMMATGAGARLPAIIKLKKQNLGAFLFIQSILAVLPILSLIGIQYYHQAFFEPGLMLNIFEITLSIILFLGPYCLLSGMLFTMYCSYEGQENSAARIYAADVAGSMAGALLFSFLIIYYYGIAGALISIIVLNSTVLIYFAIRSKQLFSALFIIGICIAFYFMYSGLETGKANMYPNQDILDYRETPYGNITVTNRDEQINFYTNGHILFSTGNVIENEEAVHFPMSRHPNPEYILLISGGISGQSNEILKYKPKVFDYVELDPALCKAAQKYLPDWNAENINIINTDARHYVKTCEKNYDIIILNLPEPYSAQVNRFYTKDFFSELKCICNKDAIVSLSLPATVNYIGGEALSMNKVVYNTIGEVFGHVRIFAGQRNYFLMSEKPIPDSIIKFIENRDFGNVYFNQYYIDEISVLERSKQICYKIQSDTIDTDIINSDFRPVSYYQQMKYTLSYFDNKYLWILLLFILPVIFIIFGRNYISLGLFAGGFSASASEFMILIAFQVIHGYLYTAVGVITALYMGGMAIGAYHGKKKYKYGNQELFKYSFGAIGIFIFLLPTMIDFLNSLSGNVTLVIILFMIIVLYISYVSGFQFARAAYLYEGGAGAKAGKAYSADLFGASLGVLLTSAYLFPVLGIEITCAIIAAMDLLLFGLIHFKNKRIKPSSG